MELLKKHMDILGKKLIEPKIYFTSDWHFNHDREFIWKQRGFSSVEEMNEEIIKRHNSIISNNDIVYCLGDCCLGGTNSLNNNKELIERLNGQIYIIRGNHCTDNRINMYKTCKNIIDCDKDAFRLKYNGYHFYMSHYPTLTGNLEKESLKQMTLNLYGHTHQKTNFYEDRPYMYHVGVDSHDCYPILLDDIIQEMKNKMNECINIL